MLAVIDWPTRACAPCAPFLRSKGGGRINGAMTMRRASVFQPKVRPPSFGSTRRMGHPLIERVNGYDLPTRPCVLESVL